MMMHLMELPTEIQEYILTFLDTTSLIQCSRVCALWKALSQGCWQHCCIREISLDVIVEILGTTYNTLRCCREFPKVSLSWESVFLKWNHYHAITKVPHQTFSLPFPNTSARNRCIIRLSGDFLILAPTVENVRVYKVHVYENGKCVGIVAKHRKPIQDIALMDIQRMGPYKLRGSHKICEHDVVVSISLDKTVQISELNCHRRQPLKIWEKQITSDCTDAMIKVFGNTFVVGMQDQKIFVWAVESNKIWNCSVTVKEVAQIQSPIPITNLSIWKDKIMSLWWDLPGVHLMTWDMKSASWSDNVYIENILCGPNILTFRSLVFGVGAQLTMLKNGQLFHKYDLWETLGQSKVPVEKITTLSLKRNLLIIGTQTGELFVFVINRDSELQNLKVISPVNVIKVAPLLFPFAQHEIKNLDISFDGSGLQIAAQTSLEVHVIRWFPFDKTFNQKPKIELPVICRTDEIDSGETSDVDYWFYDSD